MLQRARLLIVPLLLAPASSLFGAWTEYRSGPFEVLATGNEREAKKILNHLEQLRHAVATLVGATAIEPVWPMRVVLTGRDRPVVYPEFKLARDAWTASFPTISPRTSASAVQLFLDSWAGDVPPKLERGLVQLLSTLDADGTRVTIGTPPEKKDRDWSRAHMLATHPDYSGKLRVLLSNIARGVDPEVAYRNAFEKTEEQIEAELDKYITAGVYTPVPLSGKPINALRQFAERPVEDARGLLAIADVAFANAASDTPSAYAAVLRAEKDNADAIEGQALLKGDATALAAARSARALLTRASLQRDPEQKKASLTAAAAANPRWAEPHKQLAEIETHLAQKLQALRAAAKLSPGDSAIWVSLAHAQEQNNQLAEAGKSWVAAERATDDPAEKARIREARNASEQRRVEQQIAEKLEARRKAEQELNDLRNRALLEIRKAEAKANAGKPVIDPRGLDKYREDGGLTTIEGVLQQVNCLGDTRMILGVRSGTRAYRLFIPDTTKVVIHGGGERTLSCGSQRPPKKVAIQYTEKLDEKNKTTGEASAIEFR